MTHDDDDRSFDIPHVVTRLDFGHPKVPKTRTTATVPVVEGVSAPDPVQVAGYVAASRKHKVAAWGSFDQRTMCFSCEHPGACCKGLVAVSTSECLALTFSYPELLQKRRLEIVVAAHREIETSFEPGVYAKLDRPCVFATPDGSCSVYQDRPLSCVYHNLAGHYGHSSRDCTVPGSLLPSFDTLLHGMQAHIDLDAKHFHSLPGFWPGLATGLLMTAFIANGDPIPEGLPLVPVMRMQPELAMAIMKRRPQDLRVDA